MLRNYFKIAIRNLKRSKTYALINIFGLGLGIACAILIFILVTYHLSFDRFHSDADRIYRIITEHHHDGILYDAGVPEPLGKAFREEYTFTEKVARVFSFPNQLVSIPASENRLKFQEEEGFAFAEPEFFDILDFPLLRGNKKTVLNEPNTAIITRRLAKKYFGEEDPLGKTIRIANKWDYRITGVMRDIPLNTDRRQEIYLSYNSLADYRPGVTDNWDGTYWNLNCFVLLKPGISAGDVNEIFPAFSSKHYDEQAAKVYQFKLQPLADIHFNVDLGGYVAKRNLWALSLIGFFLIITVCVNFINLATAQALGRSKEIGVRKVLGSHRRQLFWQFIAETAIIALIAMVCAFLLAWLAVPYVNQLFGTQLRIDIPGDTSLLIFLPMLLLTVIFLSGSYPGLILAGFKPVLALKGKLSQKHIGGFSIRQGLVISQFAISQLLIISTLVIAGQMRYSREADLGFRKDAVVMLPVPDTVRSKMNTLYGQLSGIAGVENVSFCSAAPASNSNSNWSIRFDSRPESENFLVNIKAGDERYVPTFGLDLVAGRNLHPSDTVREYLINETAVKKLGISSNEEIIGKKIVLGGDEGSIVGVVKNFHNSSFHRAINPLCITTSQSSYGICAIKISPSSLRPTLAAIELTWSQVYPEYIYEHNFLDEEIAHFYELDYMIFRLIQVFAGIAIIIGCMGLYGLVSFMAARKVKEVGVRKVLGASVQSIVWLFGREFVRLLFIAFMIAAPLAWWIMADWLKNFVYRINIGAGVFFLAIVLTLAVAVLTVGYRSVKAALLNPVKSLRSE